MFFSPSFLNCFPLVASINALCGVDGVEGGGGPSWNCDHQRFDSPPSLRMPFECRCFLSLNLCEQRVFLFWLFLSSVPLAYVMGAAFAALLDHSEREFLRVQRVGDLSEARKAITLTELQQFRPLSDDFALDLSHLALLYCLDSNRDGTISLDDMINFIMWLGASLSNEAAFERSIGSAPLASSWTFREVVQARCVCRLVNEVIVSPSAGGPSSPPLAPAVGVTTSCGLTATTVTTTAPTTVADDEEALRERTLSDSGNPRFAALTDWFLALVERTHPTAVMADPRPKRLAARTILRRRRNATTVATDDGKVSPLSSDSDEWDDDEEEEDGGMKIDEEPLPTSDFPRYKHACLRSVYDLTHVGQSYSMSFPEFVQLLASTATPRPNAPITPSPLAVPPVETASGSNDRGRREVKVPAAGPEKDFGGGDDEKEEEDVPRTAVREFVRDFFASYLRTLIAIGIGSTL